MKILGELDSEPQTAGKSAAAAQTQSQQQQQTQLQLWRLPSPAQALDAQQRDMNQQGPATVNSIRHDAMPATSTTRLLNSAPAIDWEEKTLVSRILALLEPGTSIVQRLIAYLSATPSQGGDTALVRKHNERLIDDLLQPSPTATSKFERLPTETIEKIMRELVTPNRFPQLIALSQTSPRFRAIALRLLLSRAGDTLIDPARVPLRIIVPHLGKLLPLKGDVHQHLGDQVGPLAILAGKMRGTQIAPIAVEEEPSSSTSSSQSLTSTTSPRTQEFMDLIRDRIRHRNFIFDSPSQTIRILRLAQAVGVPEALPAPGDFDASILRALVNRGEMDLILAVLDHGILPATTLLNNVPDLVGAGRGVFAMDLLTRLEGRVQDREAFDALLWDMARVAAGKGYIDPMEFAFNRLSFGALDEGGGGAEVTRLRGLCSSVLEASFKDDKGTVWVSSFS